MTKSSAFEDSLAKYTLVAGLLPTIILAIALLYLDISIYPKVLLLGSLICIVVYCALYVRKRVVFQLRTSTNLLEAMAAGDFSMRAHNKKFKGALSEFNQLLSALTDMMAEQRLVTKEHQLLLDKVISQIDVAIIAVDSFNAISLMNPAAEKLFGREFSALEGWPIKKLGLENVLNGDFSQVFEFEVEKHPKKVYVHTDEFFEKGARHKLIFITDIQQLLRDEERNAWQRLLRVLSHEINNSLAPIASISETLEKQAKQRAGDNEFAQDLSEGLEVISERANSLNQFILRYQQLTRLPKPQKTLIDIKLAIHQVVAMFQDARFSLSSDDMEVYVDEEQLKQVLINLVKNSLEAMQSKPDGKVSISWRKHLNQICIQITDEGTGITNPDNLFIPFYTTKSEGSGIGIVLSRQIVMNHGGDLTIENRNEHCGVKASVYLPAS